MIVYTTSPNLAFFRVICLSVYDLVMVPYLPESDTLFIFYDNCPFVSGCSFFIHIMLGRVFPLT